MSMKITRLAGANIRVQTHADLHHRSKKYYEHNEQELERIAPEYARQRRKKLNAKSTPLASTNSNQAKKKVGSVGIAAQAKERTNVQSSRNYSKCTILLGQFFGSRFRFVGSLVVLTVRLKVRPTNENVGETEG